MTQPFTYNLLPDEQKRDLCVQLLAEFGGEVSSENAKGELRHRCTLPLPGHTDRNSVTASINYKKLTFHCFVCQNAGGFLWWIAVNRKQSTDEAKKWIQNASGISDVLELPMLLKLLENLAHAKKEALTPIPTFTDQVLAPWSYERWGMFHPYLTDPWEPDGAGGRECPEETLARMRVGYCDHDEDWEYYQRIIIPLFWQERLVGWQARKLDRDDPIPVKYKNSPDFPRDRTLYGYDQLTSSRMVVVVESPASVLRHQHHLPIVATMGASITDHQIKLLHGFDRVVWWLDPDKAGWDAYEGSKTTDGVLKRLEAYVEQRVVDDPFTGADPADHTDDEVDELVVAAIPYVLWRRPEESKLITYTREAA
jgi:hypothetical protein